MGLIFKDPEYYSSGEFLADCMLTFFVILATGIVCFVILYEIFPTLNRLHYRVILTDDFLFFPRTDFVEYLRIRPIPFNRIERVYTNPSSSRMVFVYYDWRGRKRVEKIWKQKIAEEGDEDLKKFISILKSKGVHVIDKDYKTSKK